MNDEWVPGKAYQMPDGKWYVYRGVGNDGQHEWREMGRSPSMSQWLKTAGQGLTFDFGDEIAGLIGGDDAKQRYREDVNFTRDQHPVGAFGAEVAGGLPMGAAGALKSLGVGVGKAALKRFLASGMAQGALAGAGAADEGSRAGGAALGGTVGAMIGGAVRGAMALPSLANPQARAQRALGRALSRSDTNVPEAIQRAVPDETLMDVGGTSVQRLARAAEATPSRGADQIRDKLVTRNDGMGALIRDQLQERAGLRFENMAQTTQDLVQQRATNAEAAYARAYQHSVPTAQFADDLSLPQFRNAYDRGRRIAAVEGVELPPLPDFAALRAQGVDPARLPLGELPVQAIDYMKRGVDDLIETGADGNRMGRTEARALRQRLSGMLSRVDEQVPDYQAARSQFAGSSSALNMLEEGQQAVTTRRDPRELTIELARMNDSEREFFRRGMMDEMRRKMASAGDGADPVRVLMGNQEMRDMVRAVFPDDASYQAFEQFMRNQQHQRGVARFVLGGSPTERIRAEREDLARFGDFKPSDLLARPVAAAQRVVDRVGAPMIAGTEGTVNELAKMLTSPAWNNSALPATLEKMKLEDLVRQQAARGVTTTAARPAGARAGRNNRR
jgi:hypothetical protein